MKNEPEAPMHGVLLGSDHTTMTLPHKRFELGRKVYFVATFPEGDLSVHEWSPGYQEGYGGSRVTFLLESDSGTPVYETVKGPFGCNDMFDFGRAKMLKERFGIEARQTAVRLRVGKDLCPMLHGREPDIHFEEPALSCDPVGPRIQALLDAGASEAAEWEFEYRGGSHYPLRGTIREHLQ